MICNSLLTCSAILRSLVSVSADPGLPPDAAQSRYDLNRRPLWGIGTGESEWLSRKGARISKTRIIGDPA